MTDVFIGWDIGGAHLKISVWRGSQIERVHQCYTPLWRGLDSLVEGLRCLPEDLTAGAQHAVTMTGELADCFSHRQEGVLTLTRLFTSIHPSQNTRLYAGELGWLEVQHLVDQPARFTDHIASMNWHATASLVARTIKTGLFVDVGSTTSDLIPVKEGKPVSQGVTDFTRLQHRELEYMGVIRTPVPMLVDHVFLEGTRIGIAREHFATLADVYRLTGDLQGHDSLLEEEESADGEDWSPIACARRLARLVCRDIDEHDLTPWKRMADGIAAEQLRRLTDACDQVIRASLCGRQTPYTHQALVAAGAGDFLIRRLAQHRNLAYHDLSDLIPAISPAVQRLAAVCAPATACAILRSYHRAI